MKRIIILFLLLLILPLNILCEKKSDTKPLSFKEGKVSDFLNDSALTLNPDSASKVIKSNMSPKEIELFGEWFQTQYNIYGLDSIKNIEISFNHAIDSQKNARKENKLKIGTFWGIKWGATKSQAIKVLKSKKEIKEINSTFNKDYVVVYIDKFNDFKTDMIMLHFENKLFNMVSVDFIINENNYKIIYELVLSKLIEKYGKPYLNYTDENEDDDFIEKKWDIILDAKKKVSLTLQRMKNNYDGETGEPKLSLMYFYYDDTKKKSSKINDF